MSPTLTTDTALQVCGVGAVLEVISAGGGKGRGLKLLRPLLIGPGQSPHLIGGQAKVTEHPVERLAAVNGVQEPLPYLDGQACLRPGSAAGALVVSVGSTALGAVAPGMPTGVGAVRCSRPHPRDGSESPLTAPCRCSSLEEHGRDDRDVKPRIKPYLEQPRQAALPA
jgi:hypothetical protein